MRFFGAMDIRNMLLPGNINYRLIVNYQIAEILGTLIIIFG